MSSCRRPPGTRSTTCPRRTCTRSSTASTRRSPRPGRRGRTGSRSTWSRTPSRGWPPDAWACGGTSSRRRWRTTARTMPKLVVVERDYGAVAERMRALGPLVERLGSQTKGASWKPAEEVEYLARQNGTVPDGAAAGRPRLDRAEHVAEAILALSGTTNGRLAVEGFRALERTTGVELADLAGPRAGDRITFADTQVQPRTVITSPEWSGIEAHGRRYAPFTMNVERLKPWHTLSGRQHFYLDHEWMLELGEGLPVFRPPLHYQRL